MVEPDDDAEPVVGEQAEEHCHAEVAEVSAAEPKIGANSDERADGAVLIEPGRVGRLA